MKLIIHSTDRLKLSREVDQHAPSDRRFTYVLEGEMRSPSDGYHTFDELYEFRKLYNAAFFNEIADIPHAKVHKSKRHFDGEECFGGGWFIVMATLPTGQISNHYELKDWDLFDCKEQEKADEWDGHTPKDVMDRLTAFLKMSID